MLDKDIRFLRRADLLTLVEEQQKENDRLRRKLTKAKHKLKRYRVEERVRVKKCLKAKLAGLEGNQAAEQPQTESKGEKKEKIYIYTRRNMIFMLIAVTAVVSAAVWLSPILRIYGTSMSPTLKEGDFVVSVKESKFVAGDLIAFYYNNNILIKRVIAQAGDWVDIDEDGTVYVNHQELDEPYVVEKALGDCNIELPYQVPESRIFVLGDYREGSVDSRNTMVGCIAEEQIVGKVIFRAWPFSGFGTVR